MGQPVVDSEGMRPPHAQVLLSKKSERATDRWHNIESEPQQKKMTTQRTTTNLHCRLEHVEHLNAPSKVIEQARATLRTACLHLKANDGQGSPSSRAAGRRRIEQAIASVTLSTQTASRRQVRARAW